MPPRRRRIETPRRRWPLVLLFAGSVLAGFELPTETSCSAAVSFGAMRSSRVLRRLVTVSFSNASGLRESTRMNAHSTRDSGVAPPSVSMPSASLRAAST